MNRRAAPSASPAGRSGQPVKWMKASSRPAALPAVVRSRAGVSRATIRPASMMAMRSACPASSLELEPPHGPPEVGPGPRVEALRGLVRAENVGNVDPKSLGGQRSVEQFASGDEGHPATDRPGLFGDVVSRHRRPSPARVRQGAEHQEDGGLASPLGAEEGEDLTPGDFERHAPDSVERAEAPAEIASHHRRPGRPPEGVDHAKRREAWSHRWPYRGCTRTGRDRSPRRTSSAVIVMAMATTPSARCAGQIGTFFSKLPLCGTQCKKALRDNVRRGLAGDETPETAGHRPRDVKGRSRAARPWRPRSHEDKQLGTEGDTALHPGTSRPPAPEPGAKRI